MLIGLILASVAALAEPERLYTEWHAAQEALGAGDYEEARKRLARAARMRPKNDPDWQASLGKLLDAHICAADAMSMQDGRAAFDALRRCGPFETVYGVPTSREVLALRIAPMEELYGWLPADLDARFEGYVRYVELFYEGPSRQALIAQLGQDLFARDDASARALCDKFAERVWMNGENVACKVRFPPPTTQARLAAALAAEDYVAAAALVREAGAEKVDVSALVGPAVEKLRAAGRELDAKRLLGAAGDAAAAEEVRVADALARLGEPLSYRGQPATEVSAKVLEVQLCPSMYDKRHPPIPPSCTAWLRPLVEAWIEEDEFDRAAYAAKLAGLDFAKEWPAAQKRAEEKRKAAAAARLEEGRPYAEAYERLRDRPDAAWVFHRLAARYGHTLEMPAVTVKAPHARFVLEGPVPSSCAALEPAGLRRVLASFPEQGAVVRVGVQLEGCELSWDRDCTTSSHRTATVVTEVHTTGQYGNTFVHTEVRGGDTVTTQTCGSSFRTARVRGRLVGGEPTTATEALVDERIVHTPHSYVRSGEEIAAERAVELLEARLKAADDRLRAARWRPEIAAGKAARSAGDLPRALEHYGRAHQLGAPSRELVDHLEKDWNVPRGTAQMVFGEENFKSGW